MFDQIRILARLQESAMFFSIGMTISLLHNICTVAETLSVSRLYRPYMYILTATNRNQRMLVYWNWYRGHTYSQALMALFEI